MSEELQLVDRIHSGQVMSLSEQTTIVYEVCLYANGYIGTQIFIAHRSHHPFAVQALNFTRPDLTSFLNGIYDLLNGSDLYMTTNKEGQPANYTIPQQENAMEPGPAVCIHYDHEGVGYFPMFGHRDEIFKDIASAIEMFIKATTDGEGTIMEECIKEDCCMKDMTVTEEMIDAEIADMQVTKMGKKTTVCMLTLKNGYEIIGTSACVRPEQYNAQVGTQLAKESARDKVWKLLGYIAQNELMKEVSTECAQDAPEESRQELDGACA